MRVQTKLNNLDVTRTMQVVNEVSERAQYIFGPEEVIQTVRHTIRKCELNGKDEEYFYILLENELRDYLMRAYINLTGEENRRRKEENVRDLSQYTVR